MSTFYEKLMNERNAGSKDSDFEMDALSKLMVIAFENKDNFDELPKEFAICHVYLEEDALKNLLERLGLNAKVERLTDYQYGYLYRIHIND